MPMPITTAPSIWFRPASGLIMRPSSMTVTTRLTRNRAIAEARAAAEATGLLPLTYMLEVMRDAKADQKRRDAMAIAAAPYLHPKLSTVDAKLNGVAQTPERISSIQVSFVRPRHTNDDDEGEA